MSSMGSKILATGLCLALQVPAMSAPATVTEPRLFFSSSLGSREALSLPVASMTTTESDIPWAIRQWAGQAQTAGSSSLMDELRAIKIPTSQKRIKYDPKATHFLHDFLPLLQSSLFQSSVSKNLNLYEIARQVTSRVLTLREIPPMEQVVEVVSKELQAYVALSVLPSRIPELLWVFSPDQFRLAPAAKKDRYLPGSDMRRKARAAAKTQPVDSTQDLLAIAQNTQAQPPERRRLASIQGMLGSIGERLKIGEDIGISLKSVTQSLPLIFLAFCVGMMGMDNALGILLMAGVPFIPIALPADGHPHQNFLEDLNNLLKGIGFSTPPLQNSSSFPWEEGNWKLMPRSVDVDDFSEAVLRRNLESPLQSPSTIIDEVISLNPTNWTKEKLALLYWRMHHVSASALLDAEDLNIEQSDLLTEETIRLALHDWLKAHWDSSKEGAAHWDWLRVIGLSMKTFGTLERRVNASGLLVIRDPAYYRLHWGSYAEIRIGLAPSTSLQELPQMWRDNLLAEEFRNLSDYEVKKHPDGLMEIGVTLKPGNRTLVSRDLWEAKDPLFNLHDFNAGGNLFNRDGDIIGRIISQQDLIHYWETTVRLTDGVIKYFSPREFELFLTPTAPPLRQAS